MLKPNLMQLIEHFAMVKYQNLHTSEEQFQVWKSTLNHLVI